MPPTMTWGLVVTSALTREYTYTANLRTFIQKRKNGCVLKFHHVGLIIDLMASCLLVSLLRASARYYELASIIVTGKYLCWKPVSAF